MLGLLLLHHLGRVRLSQRLAIPALMLFPSDSVLSLSFECVHLESERVDVDSPIPKIVWPLAVVVGAEIMLHETQLCDEELLTGQVAEEGAIIQDREDVLLELAVTIILFKMLFNCFLIDLISTTV